MKRKIEQIAVAKSEQTELVVALCNDGSVWSINTDFNDPKWNQLPMIPQAGSPQYSARNCEYCGTQFYPSRENQRFCKEGVTPCADKAASRRAYQKRRMKT